MIFYNGYNSCVFEQNYVKELLIAEREQVSMLSVLKVYFEGAFRMEETSLCPLFNAWLEI